MARIPDTPKVARRREREKRTISNMVAIYCAGNHEATARTETSHAGEALCPACKAIDDYCVLRTERCRSMAHKTSCEECGNHCYAPAQREQIRAIMRYAGPRMITPPPNRCHPASAKEIRPTPSRPWRDYIPKYASSPSQPSHTSA